MSQQRVKMKKSTVLGIGIGILGLGLWSTQSNDILKAETEKTSSQKQEVKTVEKETQTKSTSPHTLSAISNEQGLSATPKAFQLAQNANFPKAGTSKAALLQLVTNLVIPESTSGVEWEYVNEKGSSIVPSSAKSGFQTIYVKIKGNTDTDASSIQVPIPVTVTDETISTIEGDIAYKSRALSIIQTSEVIGGTSEEIGTQLEQHLGLEAWNMATGEELPITISDLDGLTETSGIATYNFTYSIAMADESVKTINRAYTLLTDAMMDDPKPQKMTRFSEEEEKEGWTEIPEGAKNGYIENPINNSVMGFYKRGLDGAHTGSNAGFIIKDKMGGENFVYNDSRVSTVPYLDGKRLYPTTAKPNAVVRQDGLGHMGPNSRLTTQFYLKKDNALKEILIDEWNQVAYVYNLTLSRNLNFSIKISMVNLANKTRDFALLDTVDSAYITDRVPLKSLGDNKGFYMKPTETGEEIFTVKLKDEGGRYLSEYTMLAAGGFSGLDPAYEGKGIPSELSNSNWFNDDFSNPGIEQYNFPEGYTIIDKTDSYYQLGAPTRPVPAGGSLDVGYEMFVGNELPYMKLETDPKEFNVYQDTLEQEFKADYTLSAIPNIDGFGNIYITYPNEQTATVPFNNPSIDMQTKGVVTIPRDVLPEKLNDEIGTIKSYATLMTAVYEKDDPKNGLPSNDHAIQVNVYNLGAKPIAQVVEKGSTWNKAESSLIKDPVIIPGHTADYKYVNPTQPVDTSKVGLQYAEIKMIDLNEADKTTIIKVPVMVVEGTPPTTGVIIGANDFSTSKAEITGLTAEELNAFIMKKSGAVAWDVETGLSEGIDVSVTGTTLINPDADGPHTATLQAKKGATIVTKTIQIKLTAKLTVNFVDEAGEPLNDPYTDTKEVGEMVDLTEITAITDILTKLKANYDMEQPDTEIIKIANGENSMTYRFKGKLMYVSLPESFDFKLNIASYKKIRVDDPKIEGSPLVISDTRLNTPGWSLKVKLQEELLNEDGKTILKNAVRYKFGDKEEILNSQALKVVKNTKPGKYDVSQDWSAEGDGLKLEIPPGAVNALGKYHGEILFELSETP